MHPDTFACPRCDYALIPVFAVERFRRRVIALTCPEPYCDHMQLLPRELASAYEAKAEPSRRADGTA